uniref:VLIG-type G domain-containing protein n=1 Tax=Nannospalax galili TaxID=1026970 RepID=A0A8C6QJC4_NANGA
MATAEDTPDEHHVRSKKKQDLQELLTEVGLSVDYWLHKVWEHLGVTCTEALQYLKEKDLQKLKSQAQHPWEKVALEKLFDLSQSKSPPGLQESPGERMKKRQRQAEQALQALRDLQSEGKHRQEEAVRTKEAELRQALEIPEECWPLPEVPLREVTEDKQRQLSHMEQALTDRQNIPDRDLVRWASGGLTLQGIYKTSHQRDLIERREELLSVPGEFSLLGPEQGKRMETKEFTTSQEESLFSQTVEKLGFTAMMSGKGEGWGFSLEGESMETHELHSENSYFCSVKFSYSPMAVCHFGTDQLQLSKAALQELKSIENLLEHSEDAILKSRTENFFHRFGSHANKGPLYLGGIYCWKAIAQDFKNEQLGDVKQQAAEALNCYVRGSYSGIALKVGVDMKTSDEHSKTTTQNAAFRNLKSSIQLSVAQIGGPPEPHIHPMDIQMALFHCADNFARQYILAKLAMCQYALPLIVPNPNCSQIESFLWSLRQIRRSWKDASKSPQDKSYSHKNQPMCSVSAPIVSFIRVGNGLSASRPQIMNSLLSKCKHDVFFHRHCRGSSKCCVLMGGLVEICWFCPGGAGEDRFDNCVAFTNLHGDAKEHKQQLAFLQEFSSVIVILMSASDDSKENQTLVRDLCQSSRPLICLLVDKDKTMDRNTGKRVRFGIRYRNEAELTEELTTAITHLLELSDAAALSLEDCSEVARKQGFLVDEDQRECTEAKEKAETIMALLSEVKLPQIKENFLPLQGELWHIWCQKDKELYHLREKGNRSIEQHKSETETEKQRIRRQQLEKAFPLNNLMRSVLGIEAISTEISDCTLGVEQLLREVCQIYEALEETSCTRDSLFLCLPQIAADLMIAGVPIELMDGDASYVPLKWMAAVFDKISEKLGDKRLFVLSVLGLQSSGKSTLLNALFGLQFTVSAGRCTRGAYMQLLKVEETFTKEFGFDFVLVVDTEGLRAPELSNKSQNRDNELATFVTGLGHLTLINIFGENPSEMQDILQIVVQAFLRMKQVKISPSCLFVHQNVGEVTAKDQNMEGRRKLEQRLDEMTALAAEQEECLHVTRFTDVIEFDVNTHVFYFESRGSIMKISDVKFRVQDLWKALISENFIFSFRNTQEIIAMSKLETMYNQWTWDLRSHILDLQNQLNNQIQNGKILTVTTNTLEEPVTKKYEAIKQEFEKYFKEDPDGEILIQWKANFEHKLLIVKDAIISETRRKANELISLKIGQESLDNQKSHYESVLLEKSQKLALKLDEKFNQLWTNWVYDVSSAVSHITEPNIDLDSENILWEHFIKEKDLPEKLKRSDTANFQIDYENHVQMRKKYFFISKVLEARHRESINKTTKNIISRFEETIQNIWRQQRGYSQNDFYEILRIIEKEVKPVGTEEEYTLTSNYSIDLSVCLFCRASKSFKEIHKAFKRANDPVNYLESKKDDFFMSFKISCQGATSITFFVDFLWLKLIPAISASIWGKLGPKIAGDMRATCPAFNGNRANLEKHILISLAEEENFDHYWQYIYYPELFFRHYISNCIRKYCSKQGSEKVQTFFKMSLGDIRSAILTAIYESTAVPKESSTASRWLDLFCDLLGSNLIFPRRELVSIEHQEINDTTFLKEAMSAALDPAMRKVEENCSRKSVDELFPEIEKLLTEHLCGCWKQCPFCKAVCTNTIPSHEGDHSVPFHRPQAVSGWHIYKTDYFAIECCSTYMASDHTFILPDHRILPYKKYRQAGGDYATWSITPDSSTQPYWKWFVCHFRSKLEEKHNKKFTNEGTIPNTWAKITKQDVLDDLKK